VQNPVFVSQGHRVSLETCVELVRRCTLFRVRASFSPHTSPHTSALPCPARALVSTCSCACVRPCRGHAHRHRWGNLTLGFPTFVLCLLCARPPPAPRSIHINSVWVPPPHTHTVSHTPPTWHCVFSPGPLLLGFLVAFCSKLMCLFNPPSTPTQHTHRVKLTHTHTHSPPLHTHSHTLTPHPTPHTPHPTPHTNTRL
jgi:hypothetical protein